MKVERLKLRAFRGVPGELDFDLTSPVTLLYAPNGTGKTSICDAAEWLLTGRVGRMKHTLRGAGEDLRCRFTEGKGTWVEALISKNGTEQKQLRRELYRTHDSLLHYRSGTGPWKRYNTRDALQWLAPLAPRYAPSGKIPSEDARRWLRATYFLEGPSLGFLIDSSPDAGETRRLLFARLLGIGELESRSQCFSRLLAALKRPHNKLGRKMADLKSRRGDVRAKLSSAHAPPEQLLRRGEDYLASARALLPGAVSLEETTPRVQLGELKVTLEGESRNAERDTELFRRLKLELPSRAEWRRQVEDNKRAETQLASEIRGETEKLKKILSDLEQAGERRSSLEARWAAVRQLEIEIDGVKGDFDRNLRNWIGFHGGEALQQEVHPSRVCLELDRLREQHDVATARIHELQYCYESFPTWRSEMAQIRQLDERLRKIRLELEDPEAVAGIDVFLKRLAVQARELRRREDDLSTALEHLRGIFLDEVVTDTDRCPLCGHYHGSSKALREAVEATLAESPDVLLKRSLRLREIVREKAKLTQRLQRQGGLEELRTSLSKERNRRAETVAKAVRDLAAALDTPNLSENDIEDGDLEGRLEKLFVEERAEAKSLQSRVSAAKEALTAGERLGDMEARLVELEKRAAIFAPSLKPSILQETPEAWSRRLDALKEIVERVSGAVTSQLASVAAEIQQLEQHQSWLETRSRTLTARRRRLRMELEEKEEKLQALEVGGRRLGLQDSLSATAALQEIERSLARRRMKLRDAAEALANAEAFIREAEELKKSSRELLDLDSELEEDQRRWRIIAEWRRSLEAAKAQLATARSGYLRNQIVPLNGVISAIFRRAQGNSVIDRIEACHHEGEEEPLEWRPLIGHERLEIEHLSLGQRQDLALAIFLARARSLGGTFFLDEPLIHLDDLNKVALLDTIRVLALDRSRELRLVVTTASSHLMSHFREKFSLVPWCRGVPPLRIYELEGSPLDGVRSQVLSVPDEPPQSAS